MPDHIGTPTGFRSAIEDVVTLARFGNNTTRNGTYEMRVGSFRRCANELSPVALSGANVATGTDSERRSLATCDLVQLFGQERVQRCTAEP